MEVKTTGAGVFLSSVRLFPVPGLPQALLLSVISPAPVHVVPVFSLQNGVVHRDLKLENILLDDNCNIKVKLRQSLGIVGGCGRWV